MHTHLQTLLDRLRRHHARVMQERRDDSRRRADRRDPLRRRPRLLGAANVHDLLVAAKHEGVGGPDGRKERGEAPEEVAHAVLTHEVARGGERASGGLLGRGRLDVSLAATRAL